MNAYKSLGTHFLTVFSPLIVCLSRVYKKRTIRCLKTCRAQEKFLSLSQTLFDAQLNHPTGVADFARKTFTNLCYHLSGIPQWRTALHEFKPAFAGTQKSLGASSSK